MSAFHEQLKRDVDAVWFNPDEFGEPHTVDGREMLVVLDNRSIFKQKTIHDFKQSERTKSVHGIYKDGITLYVRASEFGAKPRIGVMLLLDQKYSYRVETVISENGVYAMELEAIR